MTTLPTLRLRGGRIVDPANGVDGEPRDLFVRDGRIVTLAPGEAATEVIDIGGWPPGTATWRWATRPRSSPR
jgi:formylmethanofuran dehydrogenase subunit A